MLIFYLGLCHRRSASLAAVYLVMRRLFFGVALPGWPSLIVSVWMLGGLMLFCLGIIGIYLSRVFIETKQRPYTIVSHIYERADHGVVRRRYCRRSARYYADRLEQFGATPRGVDWNSAESQELRFGRLLELRALGAAAIDGHPSMLDVRLRLRRAARLHRANARLQLDYRGFDISEPMIAAARSHGMPTSAARVHHRTRGRCSRRLTRSPAASSTSSCDHPLDAWRDYVLDTLAHRCTG